jgi:ABC-type Fe3+-hydroxamate transport system substrate-binding protein
MWRTVTDDIGRRVALDAPPQRIASLVPSVTELIVHLGAGARLIAATRFCSEPPTLPSAVTRVGGTKTPARDQLIALRPDLVVLNSEENRREDFDALCAAGLALFVSFTTTVSGAAAAVRRLGAALDADAPAAALAAQIDAQRSAVLAQVERRRRVFCPIWRRPWMSFNRDTYCHDLLQCAGGDNICGAAADRYPVVALADIAAAQPEVILLPDEPYPFVERHRRELAEIGAPHATHLLDGKALSWYGPRTADALHSLAELLRRAAP